MSSGQIPDSRGPVDRGERQARIVRTFMTQSMADADIESLSTAREQELARLLDAIERSRRAAPGTLQHVVLYGNRGFGKSFMTRRVQIELARRWPRMPFLVLPEEQHSLQRDPHALLDTIALKLADQFSGGDSAYTEGHFRWPSAGESEHRWREAEAALERALDKALPADGLAIVVIENFDILLRRLFREDLDEQRLRRWLDRKANRLMLFATATGTVDMDYERPLFHAFESVRLEPWSSDDCIAYFKRLRAHQGLAPLSADMEAKARAVAEFIGGTPRLAQLLGEVLDTNDALEVAEIMAALTDRLADYYRRRIEDLAPLSIGLLDALIRGGEPASQTELAARVGAGGQSDIARVMVELQRADIVRGIPAPDSREKLYRVPDRVFVHYYRLRQGSRAAQDTPLATILDFLRSYYSRDERRQQSLAYLEAGRLVEAGLFSRLAREGERPSEEAYSSDFLYFLSTYMSAVRGALAQSADEIATLLSGDHPESAYALCQGEDPDGDVGAIRAVIRAQAVYRLGHTTKAREILETARTRTQSGTLAHFIVLEQLLYLSAPYDLDQAEHLAEAFELPFGDLPPAIERRRLRHVAWRLGNLGEHQKAIEIAAYAAELAEKAGEIIEAAGSWRQMAHSLIQLGQHEQAVSAASRAAFLAREAGDVRKEAAILRLRARSMGELGRRAEAWDDALRSINLAKKSSSPLNVSWAAAECLRVAVHLVRPEVVDLFEEWLKLRGEIGVPRLAHPRYWFGELFAAVARAEAWSNLDRVLEQNANWLMSLQEPVWFSPSSGSAFARISEEQGRAAGYEAFAHALPRIASLIDKLPQRARHPGWLLNIVQGFASACRDPGLLRDVASLMTADLADGADDLAHLLHKLAELDEARSPEVVLARMDPDLATLIRRLRGLPDPVSGANGKRGRGRKAG